MNVLDLARPALRQLRPYVPGTHEAGLVRLNANESPWRMPGDQSARGYNRYPPARPAALQSRLARHYGVADERLLVTRGSSEAIDVLIRGFCEANQDRILITPPSFDMYRLYASIQGAGIDSAPLDEQADRFALNPQKLINKLTHRTKIVFLCSPNNPTGQLIPRADLETICNALAGRALVVIDAAYHEYAGAADYHDLQQRHPHVVVLRTLSKCLSLAGVRCGALIGRPELVAFLAGILPPFSFPTPSIDAVLEQLSESSLRIAEERIALIKDERQRLQTKLMKLPEVEKVYVSDANFLLVRMRSGDRIKQAAQRSGYLVRSFDAEARLDHCVRITIGRPEDNDALLAALSDTSTGISLRTATR